MRVLCGPVRCLPDTQTVKVTGGGTDLLSTAFRLTNASLRTLVGASRGGTNPLSNWNWVDAGPSFALNCGVVGCGLWGTGVPK